MRSPEINSYFTKELKWFIRGVVGIEEEANLDQVLEIILKKEKKLFVQVGKEG